MCIFKKYSEIFGIAKTGVHSYRFLDVALFDYIGTIILAIILTKSSHIPFVISTILMFTFGIICHALFGVNTSAVNYLGLAC
jgi:hypothetical protein